MSTSFVLRNVSSPPSSNHRSLTTSGPSDDNAETPNPVEATRVGVIYSASSPHAAHSEDDTQLRPSGQNLPETHEGREHEAGIAQQPLTPTSEHAAIVGATHSKRSLLQTSIIMISLCACVFIAALEATVITTALPSMTAYFASASGYTWIGTSYILAHTASTPSWGKLSDIWGRKPLLLAACATFFLGSLLCATVGSLHAFIVARAVQGLGAGGMQTIVNICIGDLFAVRDRGMWYGLMSLIWAIAGAIGPVLGGVLTTKLSWRWCFWVNLPITGIAFLLLLFTLNLPSPQTPIIAGLLAIDWAGSALIIGATLSLLLGLYLGGIHEPWNSSTVVCLLVFGIIAGLLFIANESKFAVYPVIPPRLFNTWSSSAAYAVCFLHSYAFMGVAYYFTLYCQSVLAATPLQAGIYILPFVMSISISAALTGLWIQMTGKYTSAIYGGLTLMTLGIGLLVDVGLDLSWPKLIAFQLIAGIGTGMNFEGPLLAVQAVVESRDLGTATAAMSFVRSIATAISVVIGGVVFQTEMRSHHEALSAKLGEELGAQLSGEGATSSLDMLHDLSSEQQFFARSAYYDSMRSMWIMYASFSASGLLLGFVIRGHKLEREHQVTQLGLNTAPTPSS